MSYDRNLLPDPVTYFEELGHKLTGPTRAKWKTTNCRFHGGSDSMRVNTATGAWVCMACSTKGGDVLAHHMHLHSLEFIDAAKALGAWIEDGKARPKQKPTALSPRAALEVLGFESTIVAVAAGNLAQGRELTEQDRQRVMTCAGRINRIVEDFAQ
ncbi:MAG: CHC2 zinc finger domain-containing protein [Hydrogenophaga sp.]|uniref:CHC2 zinc finger domain-containing protein n=1 Tax=Hydrogenophaga sp. TaxID=1904254 RepID=UPI0027310880|nr:CHC2 zinc finger domain-containing protein [Hydrogenophaga sp.]MDP2165933.1 CHC2 zinc finger domain-containing protein [Hydrogenophaga sp.]MDP3476176.1 CHC2 zinc finger domain-containing protein [Hydrogenophaga sp.]